MLLSNKIIKGPELKDNFSQVLPLRRFEPRDIPVVPVGFGGEVINAASDYQSWVAAQAEEALNHACSSADEIIIKAMVECEKMKQEARQEAFEQGSREGSEKGYREGMARAEKEASAIRSQAHEVLVQAEKIRRQTFENLETEIIELAREIAEKLLSAQLSLNPGAVLNVAKEALRQVANRQNVVLYINPAELELVENKKEELKSILQPRAEFQVIADPSLLPGGCVVETEQGQIDATLEKRKEELLRALYGKEHRLQPINE
ncbi:MAG: FliH/SctL family protein [Eubacteriales bacterium]